MDEAGLKDFVVDLWLGMFAPAGHARGRRRQAERGHRGGAEETGADQGVRQGRRRTARHQREGRRRLRASAEFAKWKKVIEDGNIEGSN